MIQILFYLNNAEIICGERLEHRKSLSPLNPEFFEKLTNLVVGPFTNLFIGSFERSTLPPTLNLAHISLIFKKDEPSDYCAPVSLFGVDCKILPKLLARRLEEVMPIYVQ